MQKAWGQAATSTAQFAQARNTIQKYFQAQVLKFCHYTHVLWEARVTMPVPGAGGKGLSLQVWRALAD